MYDFDCFSDLTFSENYAWEDRLYTWGGLNCGCRTFPCTCCDPDLTDFNEKMPDNPVIEALRRMRSVARFRRRAYMHPERSDTYTMVLTGFFEGPHCDQDAPDPGVTLHEMAADFAASLGGIATALGLANFEMGHDFAHDNEADVPVLRVTFLFACEPDATRFDRAVAVPQQS